MVSRSLLATAITAVGCGRVGFEPDGGVTLDVGTGTGAYAAEVLADAPLAYFRFDELQGPVARSVVGTLTGPYQGDFAFNQPGAVDGNPSVRFDGTTTRIPLGDVFELAGNAPYSIELWINAVDVNNTRFIVDRRTNGSPSDGYTFYLGVGYFLASRITADVEMAYVNFDALPLDTWVHAVVTYDGSFQRMYIDGALSQTSNASAITPIGGGAGFFTIGDREPAQFRKLDGRLDELAIYDKALSDAAIARHYAARL